jgi:chemotaxis protein CheC
MTSDPNLITGEDKDILQEIMNIAFGKAAADLAELIDIFVVLSVPNIQVLQATDLPGYITSVVDGHVGFSLVEQNFWGEFKGNAYLVFPNGSGKELVAILGNVEDVILEPTVADLLEKETLVEVGNILIGACVGKLAELLSTAVTYSPPRVVIESKSEIPLPKMLFDTSASAIVLKTDFCFNERNVQGYMFLVTSQESIIWLKQALADFMSHYE